MVPPTNFSYFLFTPLRQTMTLVTILYLLLQKSRKFDLRNNSVRNGATCYMHFFCCTLQFCKDSIQVILLTIVFTFLCSFIHAYDEQDLNLYESEHNQVLRKTFFRGYED